MTTPAMRSVLVGLALASLLVPLTLAYNGTRLFQMLVLACPVALCLCWPSRHLMGRAFQALLAGLLGGLFITDAVIRAFLWNAYGASPASAMVITALANTTPQEVAEFWAMYRDSLWQAVLGALASLVVLGASLFGWWRRPWPPLKLTRWSRVALLLVLALVVLSMALKPWRQHHPVLFWTHWMGQVSSLQNQWSDWGAQRARWLANAQTQHPALAADAPDTVVLVIGESINRRHLSLYGYPRDTTPQLMLRQQSEAPRLGVFQHAWSADASTVAALRNFFHLGASGNAQQHVLALASQAGYQTWWITNHDDLAVDQQHAQLADSVHRLNKTPGRSGQSLDESTLPVLKAALQNPAPRKLIVLHLLGAHPHYQLRHPQDRVPFRNVKDEIDQVMKNQGRSARVRDLRNDYDSALHYHDTVVATTLDLTRKYSHKAAWVYFSDHGQEVGHVGDHVGHSASTSDGYRVPLLIWGDAIERLPQQTFSQPVRTDWLGFSLMRVLGIDWLGHAPQQDVLDERYQWMPPPLSMVTDFRS